ncbi:hypothetical protein HWV62_7772 [Athelia sp. TMB]|nr:hypothetical protein HWV62_7772 [Athelia sp. TMB]
MSYQCSISEKLPYLAALPQDIAHCQCAPGGTVEHEALESPDHAPISRLAPELLKFIFEKSCNSERLHHNAGYHHGSRESALAMPIILSHVCRLWRAITLDTPAIWTFLDRFSDDFPPVRFKNRLLSLILVPGGPLQALPPIYFPEWLHNRSHQIQNIVAEGYTDSSASLLGNVGHHYPELTFLKLSAKGQACGRIEIWHAPRMEKLFLSRVCSSLSAFANLTCLSLESLSSESSPTCPSVRELADLLRRCPMLVNLHLCDLDLCTGQETIGGEINDSWTAITLENIQKMVLEQLDQTTAEYLLSRIRVPRGAPLFTRRELGPASDLDLWLEIDIINAFIGIGTNAQAWNEDYSLCIDFPNGLTIECINSALSALDLSTVVALVFRAPAPSFNSPSVEIWHSLLARLPGLSQISIYLPWDWVEGFVEALCDDEHGILCFTLNSLLIVNVDGQINPYLGQFVYDQLRARVEAGATILDQLNIYCCYNQNCSLWNEISWRNVTMSCDPNWVSFQTSSSSTRTTSS